MGQVSSKLRRAVGAYMWFCPACQEMHPLPDGWTFNGDLNRPTFTPSFRHRWTWGPQREERCCHYIVTDGRVQFCGDCTHGLKGQTIDMPDLPPEYTDAGASSQ